MDVSFIIISYNTYHYLKPCLKSIEHHAKGVSYEIILVDNASKDGSIDYIKQYHPSVKLICNSENRGFAKANNQAVEIASGDFLFLLNADTLIQNDSLGSALEYMKVNGISILGPKLLNPDGTTQVSFQKKNTLNKYIFDIFSLALPIKGIFKHLIQGLTEAPTSPCLMGFLVGAALIIDSKVVQNFGLFDEVYFFTGEERDFCLRMISFNHKILYFPEFIIIHYAGSGDPHSTFHLVNWAKASYTLARNHGSWLSIILMKCGLSCFYMNRSILYLVKTIFFHHKNNIGLARKYLYLFLWSIGCLDEKRIV